MTMTKASDISIQFYATAEELRQFILSILRSGEFFGTVLTLNPFKIIEVNEESIGSTVTGTSPCRVYITVNKPIGCTSKLDFDAIANEPLVIDVGHLDQSGLHESWLACRAFDESNLRRWRKIAKDLKQGMESGVTATNRTNGISQYYKSYLHTEGARRLQEQGVEMIATQGVKGPKIRLGK